MASGRPFLRHVRLAAKCERLAADASLAFERAGHSVIDDPPAGKARADSSVVMQAMKLERGERVPAQTRAASAEAYSEGPGFEIITALILVGTGLLAGRRGAKRGATGSRPEWLEVYDVSRLVPTGLSSTSAPTATLPTSSTRSRRRSR